MIFETPYVATVANKQTQATIYHRLPAARIAKWSSMPRYDGKVFRAVQPYDTKENFDHFARVVQGQVDLVDIDLNPADRPDEIFPSVTGPGERRYRIPHATWSTSQSGSLFVWCHAYDDEVLEILALFEEVSWHAITLPTEVAHWAVGLTTPIIASPDEQLLESILAQLHNTYCGRGLKQA